MRLKKVGLLTVTLLALAAAAGAQTHVPANTVIPVVIESSLSSATAQVGDTFYTHCAGTRCAGFPAATRFVGEVTSVVRRHDTTPGQIEVRFTQAILPDGRTLAIDGKLASLNENEVRVDPNTGNLVGRPGVRDQRNKFIGYGAGAGLVIGVFTGNIIKGALIGAAAGWLLGATVGAGRAPREAEVAAGTEFGILLQNPVTIPAGAAAPPPAGAGPGQGPFEVAFSSGRRPYMEADGTLMVPFRTVMDQINMPFTYSSYSRTVTVPTAFGRVTTQVGTRIAYVNGDSQLLGARSRIIRGRLYVPADFIQVVTGQPVVWVPSTKVLRIG